MLVVGLTGGIATGKSTVSQRLKARGIPIIDADVLARQVVEPGTSGLARIVKAFGEQILQHDGSLDRKKLGSIIFNDESKRRLVNSIIHPAVRRAMVWGVLLCWIRGEKLCILDVPLLIEGPLWKWVGKVVVVYCASDIQFARLMSRDQSSREDAASRLNSQLPMSEKLKYADEVVDNSGTLENLDIQVNQLLTKLDKEVGQMWRLSWLFPPFGIISAIWTLGFRAMKRS